MQGCCLAQKGRVSTCPVPRRRTEWRCVIVSSALLVSRVAIRDPHPRQERSRVDRNMPSRDDFRVQLTLFLCCRLTCGTRLCVTRRGEGLSGLTTNSEGLLPGFHFYGRCEPLSGWPWTPGRLPREPRYVENMALCASQSYPLFVGFAWDSAGVSLVFRPAKVCYFPSIDTGLEW